MASFGPFLEARSVGFYKAVDNEVDPSCLFLHTAHLNKLFFLPVTDRESRKLRFVHFRPGDALRPGAFGILEPLVPSVDSGCDSVDEIDLLFVPLVGFDLDGFRLGFGGGYYDRLLARDGECSVVRQSLKPLRVGLGFGCQQVEKLPQEPHDVPLHYVITEDGVICFL